jgi:ankyrin repeat protein
VVWHERLATVKLLIERGAPLEATNGRDETPLSLAITALVEMSEWTPHGSTDIVAALLDAGARVESVKRFPSGSTEADELLRRHGRVS